MLPEIKYLSVNWIDGMKVNKNHFIQLENALNDQLRDSIGFNLTNAYRQIIMVHIKHA